MSDKAEADHPDAEPVAYISPAVRRRHSTEYVNLQIRTAVLETRLATADEAERKLLSAKLEQVKAEMRIVDAACKEESGPAIVEPAAVGPGTELKIQR